MVTPLLTVEQVASQDAHQPVPPCPVVRLLGLTVDAGPPLVAQPAKLVDRMADAVHRTATVAQQPISQYPIKALDDEADVVYSCGAGCQSGCTSGGTPTPSKKPTSTSAPPAASTEPVLGKPSNTPVSGGPPTKDGTCGSSNGNTVCGTWPQGACCSMYGVSLPKVFRGAVTDDCSFVATPLLTAGKAVKVDHAQVLPSHLLPVHRQPPLQRLLGLLKFLVIHHLGCRLVFLLCMRGLWRMDVSFFLTKSRTTIK